MTSGINPSRRGQTSFTQDLESLWGWLKDYGQGVSEGRWATPYANTPATDVGQRAEQLGTVANEMRPTFGTDWDVAGAKEDIAAGRYGQAALKLGQGVGNAALDVVDMVDPGTGTVIGSTLAAAPLAIAKRTDKVISPSGKVLDVPKGKREAVGAVSLRDLDPAEASRIAQTERHLQPAPPAKPGAKQGAYAGGPVDVQTRADLEEMRRRFDEDVKKGVQGADWYERTQNWVKEMAGDDPARQSELARNLALFSAQADPDGNLGFAIAARNAATQGMPAAKVRTGQQARTYNEAFYGDGEYGQPFDPSKPWQDIKLGPKTGIFGGHMDPTRTNPVTGTNDIWHARAFGYTNPKTGKPWSAALGDAQHAFMDYETVLAVDRANAEKWGGRENWSPGEVQAAPWVEGKAQGLLKKRKNWTYQQALDEASKTYPDYAPKYTAFGTYEHVPGKTTGHREDIAKGSPETREAYAMDPRLSWVNAQTGRDVIHGAQGGYVGRTRPTTGVFEGEVNRGNAAPALVSYEGKSGEREVDMPSRQMMTGGEAFRAYVNAQDAGAWSIPVRGQKVGRTNAYEVNLPPGTASPQRIEQLDQLAGQYMGPGGFKGGIHYGTDPLTGQDKAIVTNFDPSAADSKQIQSRKNLTAFETAAGVPAQRVERQGDYIPYQEAWGKGEGSDAATQQMLSQITPVQEQYFSRPEVREVVQRQWQVDEEARLTGAPVRQDIQTARRLIAEGGIPALRDALGKGILPAAAVAAVLSQVPGQGGQGEEAGAPRA